MKVIQWVIKLRLSYAHSYKQKPQLTPEVSATDIQPGAETKLCDLGEHLQAPWINKEQPKLNIINAKD